MKYGCSGTSNTYQTLPLLAKRFGGGWWSKSEGNQGGSNAVRLFGEARERRPVRASALNFTTARTRRQAPRGAHVGRTVDKASMFAVIPKRAVRRDGRDMGGDQGVDRAGDLDAGWRRVYIRK